jgi:hypothetical protein
MTITMKATSLLATSILAVSCALLTTSCVLRPESSTETKPDEPESSIGPEAIGETEQEVVGGRYVPEDFQFVVIVKDDGEGKAAGWQVATTASTFATTASGRPIYRWECRLEIGMPLRSEKEGPISASRAARTTADITNDVALPLLSSRKWVGQGAVFCQALKGGMTAVFESRPYEGFGARVRLNP